MVQVRPSRAALGIATAVKTMDLSTRMATTDLGPLVEAAERYQASTAPPPRRAAAQQGSYIFDSDGDELVKFGVLSIDSFFYSFAQHTL